MFGYVTPHKPELKMKHYDAFKSYYCGLCQHIKKDYGDLPRLTLSYDITSMCVLLDALSPDSTWLYDHTCIANPLKKRTSVQNNLSLKYGATINFLLSYYKLKDNVDDENDLKSKIALCRLRPHLANVPKEFDFMQLVIMDDLKKLNRLEKTLNFETLDEISHPFAKLVGNILKLYPYPLVGDSDELRAKLYIFGYTLGKWIYLLDALDDLEKDMKSGSFNPLLVLDAKDRVQFSIVSCARNCENMFYQLPIRRNKELLKNIVTFGMETKYMQVSRGCKKCEQKKSSAVVF